MSAFDPKASFVEHVKRFCYYNLLAIIAILALAYTTYSITSLQAERRRDRQHQVESLCSAIEKLRVPLVIYAKTAPEPSRSYYLNLLDGAKCSQDIR